MWRMWREMRDAWLWRRWYRPGWLALPAEGVQRCGRAQRTRALPGCWQSPDRQPCGAALAVGMSKAIAHSSITAMSQRSFASTEYALTKKRTRRELFLADTERVVPWPQLIALIEPLYPTSGRVGPLWRAWLGWRRALVAPRARGAQGGGATQEPGRQPRPDQG